MEASFTERLRNARKSRGLSQAELAQRAGLEPSAVSHFEAGRRQPSFHNLRKLADSLGVTTDYLLGRDLDLGASGPAVEGLWKRVAELSDVERELLDSVAETLIAKRKKFEQEKAEGRESQGNYLGS